MIATDRAGRSKASIIKDQKAQSGDCASSKPKPHALDLSERETPQ
jgi:hypothetical protein